MRMIAQPGEEEAPGGLTNVCKYRNGGTKKSLRLFSVVPRERTKGNRHKLGTQEIRFNMRKIFFIARVVITWEQIAQRGCGAFSPGDTQSPRGHSPGEPAPSYPGSEQWGWTPHPSSSAFLHTWPGSFQSHLDPNSSASSIGCCYFVCRSTDFLVAISSFTMMRSELYPYV